MFDSALIIGILITLAAVVLAVGLAVVLFRRRGSAGDEAVPPPIDPGPGEPEQARDLNAEK